MTDENKYYKESGKFSPVGAVLITLATAALGTGLFFLYILFNGWCTFIYLNVIAAFGAAAIMGFVVSRILQDQEQDRHRSMRCCGLSYRDLCKVGYV